MVVEAVVAADGHRPRGRARVPAGQRHARASGHACLSGSAEDGLGASTPAFARDLSGRVHKRTLARRMGAGRVRLRTRGARACAKSDTRRPIRAFARPFVHTGRPGVCIVGREAGHTALYLSVCAHGTPRRVQSRTMPAVVYQGLAAHKNKSFDVADEFMLFPMSQ